MDPVMMVITLYASVIYYLDALTPKYIVLSIFVFALTFPSDWEAKSNFYIELKNLVNQWCFVIGVLFFFGYATDYLAMFSRSVLLAWVLITPILLLLCHLLAAYYLSSDYYLSRIKKNTIIVGYNELGMEVKNRVSRKPDLGFVFDGFFDDSFSALQDNLLLKGSLAEVSTYVKNHNIHQILIALPTIDKTLTDLLDSLKDTTASIYYVPDFFMTDLIQARIDDIDGMPVVAVCETPFSGVNGAIKRTSDILLSCLILLCISPMFILIGLGVKLSSKGPIIFKQRRYGLDGQQIIVYKFRSMTVMEDGPNMMQATPEDKRVTNFGRFLRKTSLDELPQFINVLQGRMSIVGPRPHAVAHNEIYRSLIKGYMIRHKVRPGITGWAQINGFRGETTTVESMRRRIEYDLQYLNKWSLGLDLKIVFKTIYCVFSDQKAY
jgi:putative colanic acid biosysnthesis UDP-glucose lipid carrier transferase